MSGRRTRGIAVLACLVVALAAAGDASAITGNQPIAVVLCKFTDRTGEPHPQSYYQNMFSETGAGQSGVFDYWKDNSYGQLDLTGTVVKGWYTVPKTVAEWNALPRNGKVDACATQADPDIDFSKYAGVVTLTNQTGFQEDLFGAGPPTAINGTTYANLGRMDSEEDQQFNGILHESAHLLRIQHSRILSQTPQQDDYGDQYDIGSCLGCYGTTSPWGANGFRGAGPGSNVVQRDTAGWIAAGRKTELLNGGSCTQSSIQLAALNHPEAAGFLEATIPASIFIKKIGTSTTSDHYAVELRERSGWDAGIPADSVLVHLHGQDTYSYLVDQSGLPGAGSFFYTSVFNPEALALGDEYVDLPNKAVVAVNGMDASTHLATVTLASCKINAALGNLGPASGDFSDTVTLTADLTVSGSGAPVPNQPVTLSIGTQSCSASTDAAGHGACQVTLNQHPGSYTLSASFAGDQAYNAANASTPFTINQEQSQLTYTGATTSDYHDAFTASATLVDPDGGGPIAGKSVTFTLGASDTCTATTTSAGVASCSITPNQVPGPYTITAAFGPDTDYQSSGATQPFAITREQTTTIYTGPTVILQGASGVKLEGKLLEDGVTPISGRTLTLKLGAQSCTGTTGANGVAGCTLTFTGALGGQQLSAIFAGDAYYLPSSDTSKTATVFAFPSRGAFVLGDTTAAAATPFSTVTWWGSDWSSRNALSGGAAPAAFKGFADSAPLPTSTPPAACGGIWTSGPGNSSKPPASVPSYMGVLVAGSVSKSGSTISGNTTKIVVVRTNPGYADNPGHAGTGSIVATYC
jgi:M6 family metalloprotease-like protein